MRPELFEIGQLEVRSWGVMFVLALLAAGWVVDREMFRLTGRRDLAMPLVMAAGIGGMVGARLYYLAEHAGSVELADALSDAGFTWYGGVIGGAIAVLVVIWIKKVPVVPLLGASAPALALGYAIGRIGCQLAGDGTYGSASDLPLAMSYPNGEVPTNDQVHPTPVYETLASLVIFGILWRLRRQMGGVRLIALYLLLAGAARFLVEFVRRNDQVLLGLTQPQLFAALMVVVGVAIWLSMPKAFGLPSPLERQPDN